MYNRIESLLRSNEWYSRKFDTLLEACGGDIVLLFIELSNLSLSLQIKGDKDKINIFAYEDVVYVGLESRRLDYEREVNKK
jgi:hypothetical protein